MPIVAPTESDVSAGLVKPVRSVAFSPGGKILAAAGDSRVIVLYDTSSGEQIANLSGHSAWVLSLSWSVTGEFLLSRYVELFSFPSETTFLLLIMFLVPLMAKLRFGPSITRHVLLLTPRPKRRFGASSGYLERRDPRPLRLPVRTGV